MRVKQRIATYDGKEHEKQLDLLSRKIVGVLLSWGVPTICTLKSADSVKKLSIRGIDNNSTSNTENQTSSRPFDISLTRCILSQAGYIQPSDWQEWIETSVCTSLVTVHGAISLKPAPSRNLQFISLGVRCLNAETDNTLFDEINQKFMLSDFGKSEDISDLDLSPRKRDKKENLYEQSGFTNKKLKGGGKGVDRWPSFFICINLKAFSKWSPGRRAERIESDNVLSCISDALEAMITSFLNDHHFRPRAKRSKTRSATVNASDRSKILPNSKLPSPVKDKSMSLLEIHTSDLVDNSRSNRQTPEAELSSTKLKQPEGIIPRISADILSSIVVFPTHHRRNLYEDSGCSTSSRIRGMRQEDPSKLLSLSNSALARRSISLKEAANIKHSTLTHTGQPRTESTEAVANAISPKKNKPNVTTDVAFENPNKSTGASSEIHFADAPIESPIPAKNGQNTEIPEDIIEWVNPISGATTLVSSRTGLVIRPQPKNRSLEAMNIGIPNQYIPKPTTRHTRLTRCPPTPSITPRKESWASEFLKNWENPVFSPTEKAVPRISLEGPNSEASCILQGRQHQCSDIDIQKALSESSSLFSAKLTKEALKIARVIAQVDKKFILVLTNVISQVEPRKEKDTNPQRLLVLIDQHAADERVRVEALQADLCKGATSSNTTNPTTLSQNSSIETQLLTKPIVFFIQEQEYKLFESQASHFAKWGILYSLSGAQAKSLSTKSKECKVIVKNLPDAFAERCRVYPRTLIDLMREEVWRRHSLKSKTDPTPESSAEGKIARDATAPPTQANDWIQRMGDCPRGILDMLNSRSCRSAIMFNDALTLDECQTLVQRLSACVFPFQCAHGRPSMMPLVQLGEPASAGLFNGHRALGKGFGPGVEDGERRFGSAWRDWRAGLGEGGW